jgi:anti-anti-sigma factor
MTTALTLNTARCDDGHLVLTARGEIDLSNIDAFNRALDSATAEASGATFLVDLGAVEYLDSAAINALFAHADHIRLRAHPYLSSILVISGLAELVPVDAAPEDT